MKLIQFIIESLKLKEEVGQLPIEAVEGAFWSTWAGQDAPFVEIDWDKLQEEMEKLEQEFSSLKKDGKDPKRMLITARLKSYV